MIQAVTKGNLAKKEAAKGNLKQSASTQLCQTKRYFIFREKISNL